MAYYLRYHNVNYCFNNYYLNSHGQVCFHDLLRNIDKNVSADLTLLRNGYVFDSNSGICEYNTTLYRLGVTYNNYNFLLGLAGLLFGAFVLLSLFTVFINITRRN